MNSVSGLINALAVTSSLSLSLAPVHEVHKYSSTLSKKDQEIRRKKNSNSRKARKKTKK